MSRRFSDLSTAEKAKHTRMYNKLDAERDEILKPFRDEWLKVAHPLWDERDAKIDAAAEIMQAKIDELKMEFAHLKESIMDEYANKPEYKALNDAYESKCAETWHDVQNQMKELEKSLGLR